MASVPSSVSNVLEFTVLILVKPRPDLSSNDPEPRLWKLGWDGDVDIYR